MARTKLDPSSVPLIVEEHPADYNGLPFITYIQFRSSNALAIIDNIHNKQIQCYVLDLCHPEGINEQPFLQIVYDWFENYRHIVPLSIHLNRNNIGDELNKVYRTYNIEFITRIVGPLFTYPIHEVTVTRRKRRKQTNPKLRVV